MNKKEGFIVTIDQSTSGTKALIINKKGKIVNKTIVEHKQFYPQPGWVEHDPEEIFTNTIKAIKIVIDKTNINPLQIKSISITNQRETVVVWDKETSKPIYNAVVWQCQRGKNICGILKEKGYGKLVKEKTGLIIDPYFSASGIKWILANVKGAREKAENNKLVFGTIDSWLIWKLTDGESHVTDYSNASRTMLFNIKELKWDKEIMDILSIPLNMTPDLKYSDEIFGFTTLSDILKEKIPIIGVLGDSHAALFGQKCFQKGMVKATYGTGSSIAMNIGEKPQISYEGIMTSIGWGIDGKINYIYEGNIHSTGATIKWLVEKIKLISDSYVSSKMALKLNDNGGVYFIPAFVGLAAPYWNNDIRATITGMTFDTDKRHIVRSALESIAYQIKDVVDLMSKEANINIKELKVDGGPTKNKFLMQFQADMLNKSVCKVDFEELSAIGVAYISGLSIGFWESIEEIKLLNNNHQVFESKMNKEDRAHYYAGWKEAVASILIE